VARDKSRAEHDATKADENPLWIYALKQYNESNCAEFLIQAQDELGLDVNVLLLIGWLAASNLTIDIQAIMHARAFDWQKNIVKPLRKIRRQAKEYAPEDFYQKILALELSAEKQQLQDFYQLSLSFEHGKQGFKLAVKTGCEEYLKLQGKSLEESWLQALIEHLQPNKLD